MSVQAIVWVLEECPDLPKHLVGTMVGLANHANENGCGSYPSQPLLAWYARKDERAIRNDLKQAEELGIIRRGNQRMVLHLPEDKRPIVWDLAIERKRTPRPDAKKPGRRPKDPQVNGGPSNPPEAHFPPNSGPNGNRAEAHFQTGGKPTANRAEADFRLTAREPSLEPNPPLPPAETASSPAPPASGEGIPEKLDEPRRTALDDLVDSLIALSPSWKPDETRQVLTELRDRGTSVDEISRVAAEVASGVHGQTRSPRRMLVWWPTPKTAEPSWVKGPVAYLQPGTAMCRTHPGEPDNGCGKCKTEQFLAPSDLQAEALRAALPESEHRMTAADAKEMARATAAAARTGSTIRPRRLERIPSSTTPAPTALGDTLTAIVDKIGARA